MECKGGSSSYLPGTSILDTASVILRLTVCCTVPFVEAPYSTFAGSFIRASALSLRHVKCVKEGTVGMNPCVPQECQWSALLGCKMGGTNVACGWTDHGPNDHQVSCANVAYVMLQLPSGGASALRGFLACRPRGANVQR